MMIFHEQQHFNPVTARMKAMYSGRNWTIRGANATSTGVKLLIEEPQGTTRAVVPLYSSTVKVDPKQMRSLELIARHALAVS